MAIDDVDDPCPRQGCDFPYSDKVTTAKSFQQKTMNLSAAKTCFIPTTKTVEVDGEEKRVPAITLVYHTYSDIASVNFDEPSWANSAELDADADPSGPGDLGDDYATVFEIIRESTAENNSILAADLKPVAMEEGVDIDDIWTILLNLLYHEFIVEGEDAVFKVPPEVVL